MNSAASILLLLFGSMGVGQETPKGGEVPRVLRIEENERVVHVIGTPFDHSYYEAFLETFLLKGYAHKGLVYRRVAPRNLGLEDLSVDRILIHNPTLVVLQMGNQDLSVQYRRPKFDFSRYPQVLESRVKALREKKIKVVICSTIPVGSGSGKVTDGLKTWVDAARDIAARHDAIFVDLFTDALTWRMIGPEGWMYDPEGQEKSWRLFLRQVSFVPSGSTVRVDMKKGSVQTEGASVSDLKRGDKEVSFVLQNAAGAGAVMLYVEGLPGGTYALQVEGKAVGTKSSQALQAGVDVGDTLELRAPFKDLKEEIALRLVATAQLEAIRDYRLPNWVKVPDFENQKQRAYQGVLETLARYDASVREKVRPKPMKVTLKRQ